MRGDPVERLAQAWLARQRALDAAGVGLVELAALDMEVEAAMIGLRVHVRWPATLDDPGFSFAAAWLALEELDLERFAAVLNAGGAREIVAALAWSRFERIGEFVDRLLSPSCSALLRAIGIAACAAHRHDPGEPLTRALRDPDPALRRRALVAAGQLGRVGARVELQQALGSQDREVRFAAASSLALLGDPSPASELWSLSQAEGALAERACSLAVRCSERERAHAELRALLDSFERTAIVGIGALGDPTMLPALMESMREPALVQLAREAFTLITGLELEAEDGPDVVEAAIEGNAKEWNDASRLLLGRRPNARRCVWLLHDGLQRHRAAAAIELKLLQPDKPLFETRAPVSRQRRALVRAHSWQVP
jgi:uncharacterized protein (TIGR02270 family)